MVRAPHLRSSGASHHQVQWRFTLTCELLQGATWTEGDAISDATGAVG